MYIGSIFIQSFFVYDNDWFPAGICDLGLFWLSCLGPLVLFLPDAFKLFGFPIFRFWAYLAKVFPETRCTHLIWYLRFYLESIQKFTSVRNSKNDIIKCFISGATLEATTRNIRYSLDSLVTAFCNNHFTILFVFIKKNNRYCSMGCNDYPTDRIGSRLPSIGVA